MAVQRAGVCEVAVKRLKALQRTREQAQKAAILQTQCKAKFATSRNASHYILSQAAFGETGS